MLEPTLMRRSLPLLLAVLGCACSSSGGASGGGKDESAGIYEVPTTPDLADAARYPVDRISWRNDGTFASLDYDLPKALVGKTLHVAFEGAVKGNTAYLTGEAGTADCTIGATSVVCHETMRGLLPLEPDLDVVSRLAPEGAAQARIDIARSFSTDPIGIATVSLGSAKADDDTP